MRLAVLLVLAAGFFSFGAEPFVGAAEDASHPLLPVLNPEKEGQELVARALSLQPVEESVFAGLLKIRRRGQPAEQVPLTSRVDLTTTNWQMKYESAATPKQPAERLVVVHTAGQPNVYLYARGTNAPAPLAGHEAAVSFAGSDFSLADLGLEFLHWPHQRLLKREMRKGRPCQVLESKPAPSGKGAYARVVSVVDVESGGILMAEAHNAANRVVKDFEVEKFTKVKDRWHLERMEMRSPLAGSRTEIQFDVTLPAASETPRE